MKLWVKEPYEQAIWQIISAAVKESLGKFNAVPTIDFDTADMPDIPAFEQNDSFVQPQIHYNSDFNPFKSFSGGDDTSAKSQYGRSSTVDDWQKLYSGEGKPSKMNSMAITPDVSNDEEESVSFASAEPIQTVSSIYSETSPTETNTQYFQLKGRYIQIL